MAIGNTILMLLTINNMKTSSDVVHQRRKLYAQTNMLLRNFHYCTNDVKCKLFQSFCANMYCCPLWFNSTLFTIKKLKKLITTCSPQFIID